jgi:TRAP-type mannitol/chloroaromatic compound transport system substrate-binding protein
MLRRNFLKGAGIGVVDTIFGAAETFANYVSDATDGKFKLQVFPAGELVPGLEAADAGLQGTVEACHTVQLLLLGQGSDLCAWRGGAVRPERPDDERLVLSWRRHRHDERVLRHPEPDRLPGGNTGVQMAGWYRKEINSVADLRG